MSRVRDEVTGQTIANQVRLESAVNKGAFLLVEGSSDYRLFSRFTHQSGCSIIVCEGRENLLSAITILEDKKFYKAVGFADKDYSDVVGYPHYSGAVVFTDENDLDLQILRSSALSRVLFEYGNKVKVDAVAGARGVERIAEMISEHVKLLGALRLASQNRTWNLKFDDMTYQFLDNRQALFSDSKTIQHVLGRTKGQRLTQEEVLKEVVSIIEAHHSLTIANGHDSVVLLARMLRNNLGNCDTFDNSAGRKNLERVLRVAYDFHDFCTTNAYRLLCMWEAATKLRIFSN